MKPTRTRPRPFLALSSLALVLALLLGLGPVSALAADDPAAQAEPPAASEAADPPQPQSEVTDPSEAPADETAPEDDSSEDAPPEETPAEEPPAEEEAAAPAGEEAPAEEEEVSQADALDLAALVELARQDGAEAARAVNAIEDADQHEEAVKAVLDLYYTEDLPAQLAAFAAEADERASTWLEAYARAAEERADDSLSYEAGQVLLLAPQSFGMDSVAAMAEEEGGSVLQSTSLDETAQEMVTVELPLWQTVAEAQAEYEAQGVEVAQPNFWYDMDDADLEEADDSFGGALPDEDAALESDNVTTNDPLRSQQWYLNNINLAGAWGVVATKNHPKVRVAVIDNGPNITHPDLTGNVNHALSKDLKGGTPQPISFYHYHGTHVSGTIAAQSNNGQYYAGVGTGYDNRAIELMCINAFESSGRASTFGVVSAIEYAIANGARVINMSLGGYGNDSAFASIVAAAHKRGVTVVASAGNDGISVPTYPSDYPTAISVIALDRSNAKAYYSNFGAAKWIAAPGGAGYRDLPAENIWNISYPAATEGMSGTSMAAPIVTAIAAMMYYVNPSITPTQVKALIGQTATDLGAPGKDINTGYGLINATAAVTAALNAPPMAQSIKLNMTAKTLTAPGKKITLKATVQPSSAADKKITWKSSNKKIATVSAKGVVTAKKKGTAKITATNAATGVKSTCTIRVGGTAVKSVKLNAKSKTLKAGKSYQLKATLNPTKPTNKKLLWSSSNPAVATVNSKGKVRAVSQGTAKITVTSQDGGKKKTCTIKVK